MTHRQTLPLALLVLLIGQAPARAQTFTWNVTGGGAWNDANNWNPNNGFPNATTHEARFGDVITSTATVTVPVPITVNQLTFDGITGTKAYSIGTSANTLTFGGTGATLRSNANVISTGEQLVGATLAGTANVVIDGGRVTFGSNLSTFTGSINVNAGRLRTLPNGQNSQPLGATTNVITVANGGQLFVDAQGFNDAPYPINIAGSGPAGLPADQSGAIRWTGFNPSRWVGTVNVTGDATIRFSASTTLLGTVNLQGSNTLTMVGGTGLVQFGGNFAGTGNLATGGGASALISTNSTYTGLTTVNTNSAIGIGANTPNALGASLGTESNKVILRSGGGLTVGNTAVGNKRVTLDGGSFGASGISSWAGAVDLTANSFLFLDGGAATFTLTGGISNPGFLLSTSMTAAQNVVNLNTVGMSGTGGFTMASAPGTVNFNVTSTYSGLTTVTSGRLFANAASATGSGSVLVNGGGVLRGTGSVAGPVSVIESGVLFPGAEAAPGTLTFNNNVMLAAGTDFQARVNNTNAGTYDSALITAGVFSFQGADLILNTSAFAGTVDGTTHITLVDAVGAASIQGGHIFTGLPNGALAAATSGGNLFIHYAYGSGGEIYLTSSAAVPEPTTLACVALAAALVGWRYGRGVRPRDAALEEELPSV